MGAASTAQVLISARGKSSDSGMAMIDEYFRLVAQRIRSRLVNRCSGDFDVVLAGIDIMPACEIPRLDAFSETGVGSLLRYEHLPVTTAVVVQRSLLTRIIGAMLGAEAPDEDEEEDLRPLSPVELRIARRVFDDIVHEAMVAWPQSPEPVIKLFGAPAATRHLKLNPERGDVYGARFEVGLDSELFGSLLLTLPTELMRQLSRNLRGHGPQNQLVEDVDLDGVLDLEVDIVAEMDRLAVPLHELRDLQVGAVLHLSRSDRVKVLVNGKPVLLGEAGEHNGRRSLRVIRRLS